MTSRVVLVPGGGTGIGALPVVGSLPRWAIRW
jgi:hypothetical protein